MVITSQGINSDLIFVRYNGVINDHNTCIEARTPHNPEYYFGNFLIFGAPPKAGEVDAWESRFEKVFSDNPLITHKTFCWSPEHKLTSDVKEKLLQRGYEIDRVSVLGARKTTARYAPPDGVDFRVLTTDSDWAQALQNQIDSRDMSFALGPYAAFKQTQMNNYRAMQQNGWGHWYGAFKGDKLVANMGIFSHEQVSRFQSVVTDAAHRRQGICSALVHYVSSETLKQHPANQLIIMAEKDEPAERIYSALGFELIEVLESALLRPAASYSKPD